VTIFSPFIIGKKLKKSINCSFPCGGECSKMAFSRRLKCTILVARNKRGWSCGTELVSEFVFPHTYSLNYQENRGVNFLWEF